MLYSIQTRGFGRQQAVFGQNRREQVLVQEEDYFREQSASEASVSVNSLGQHTKIN